MATGVAPILGLRQCRSSLEDVERGTGVSAGEGDEVVERLVDQGHATRWAKRARQSAVYVPEGAPDDDRDRVIGEWFEAPDAHPRQECAVDFEVGVLRRRADEGNGPVLDVWQQGVLLGLVEAVDLVDEQDGAGSLQGQAVLGLGDGGPEFGHAGHDRRDAGEAGADLGREQAREAGLAGAGRTPQQERGEMPAGNASSERTALTDQVLLPDELVEVAWPHPGREWLLGGGWLEQRLGSGALGPPGGRHGRMVARQRLDTGAPRSSVAAKLGVHRPGTWSTAFHANERDPLRDSTVLVDFWRDHEGLIQNPVPGVPRGARVNSTARPGAATSLELPVRVRRRFP